MELNTSLEPWDPHAGILSSFLLCFSYSADLPWISLSSCMEILILPFSVPEFVCYWLVTCRNQLAIFWISVKWITWRNRQKCEGRKFSQMPFQTHWNVQLWRLTIINLSVDVWQWQLQQGANGKVETRLKTNAAALISRHFLNSAIPYLSICSRKMIPYVYIKVFKKKDSLFLLCFLP